MITQNELYDLSFVISLIRDKVDDPNNVLIMDSILNILKDPSALIENNQLRKVLSQISQLDEKWEFVKHENYYVRTMIFKDTAFQDELFQQLNNLKLLLQAQNYEQAYDLADALHALPEIIADNKGKTPNSYYKVFLKPYQRKWKTN